MSKNFQKNHRRRYATTTLTALQSVWSLQVPNVGSNVHDTLAEYRRQKPVSVSDVSDMQFCTEFFC